MRSMFALFLVSCAHSSMAFVPSVCQPRTIAGVRRNRPVLMLPAAGELSESSVALALTTAERMADLPHSALTVAVVGPYVAIYAFLKKTGLKSDADRPSSGVSRNRRRQK